MNRYVSGASGHGSNHRRVAPTVDFQQCPSLGAVDRLASSLVRSCVASGEFVVDLRDPVSCEVLALALERIGCEVIRLGGHKIRVSDSASPERASALPFAYNSEDQS